MEPCIPAEPDISGIGVRTATYAQNLLSFGPAIYALLDKKVTSAELDSLETQSTTILITAFAILLSAIVQAKTQSLSNFHATIILNLSWMNNTNTFIYFLLLAHSKVSTYTELHDEAEKLKKISWSKPAKMLFQNPVLVIGSLHLSLMAAVGLWLWSQPATFGRSPSCAMSASIIILGRGVQLGSKGLQDWSIFIYVLLLVPGLNLVIPIIVFVVPYLAYNRLMSKTIPRGKMSIIPVGVGLGILAIINVAFIIDTEVGIQINRPMQEAGESDWTFGQTLAMLLLLVPLRDLVETFLERHQKKVDSIRMQVTREGINNALVKLIKNLPYPTMDQFHGILDLIHRGAEIDVRGKEYEIPFELVLLADQLEILKYLVEHGANIHAPRYQNAVQVVMLHSNNLEMIKFLTEQGISISTQGGYFGTPLQAASRQGNLEMVKFFLGYWADVNGQGDNLPRDAVTYHIDVAPGEPYGTALQAASSAGHLDIVQLLIQHGADVNIEGGPYGTALQAASYAGHLEIVKYLIRHGADMSIKGRYGTALQVAISHKHLEIVDILRGYGNDLDSV